MKRGSLLSILAISLALIGLCSGLALGQDIDYTRLSINMTGVNASFLTIGMSGVGSSSLVINTVIVEIELTGLHAYPVSCSFGLIRPGDIRSTDPAFTLLNATNGTINATIAVSGDWYGSTNWTHSDDCIPGAGIAGLIAVVEDGNGYSTVIVKKTAPYNLLVANLDPDGTCDFALEFYAPTSFTDYSPKSNSIFIEISGG